MHTKVIVSFELVIEINKRNNMFKGYIHFVNLFNYC